MHETELNPAIACKYPKSFFAGFLILALFFIAFNPFVKTVSNVDYFTLENSPQRKFYEHFKKIFGNDVFFVIAFQSNDLFSPEKLTMLRKITTSLENLPDVKKVTSLANVNEISGGKDYFEVRKFIEKLPGTQKEQNVLKTRALENPLYTGNLISKDGRTTAIVVEPRAKTKDKNLKKRLLKATRAILAPYETSGTHFYIAGGTATNYYLAHYLNTDSLVFVPVTFFLVTLITWFIFRSKTLTLLAVINIALCVGATRGLMGLLGITVNNITTLVIPLIMALTLSDIVHIFSHMESGILARHPDSNRAMAHIIRELSFPCFLTTLTTAFGFASFFVSDIRAIKEFGMVASAGMIFEYLFSFFLLPPLLIFCKPEHVFLKRSSSDGQSQNLIMVSLRRLFSFEFRFYRAIVVLGIAIMIISAIFASRIHVETNLIDFFKKNSPVRTSVDFIEHNLSGVEPLDISFQASKIDAFKDPENLKVIETVQNYVKSLPGVDKTMSFVDFLKDMNKSFHAESPRYYRIPASRQLVSQYLLMYDSEDIDDYINSEFDHARLAIRSSLHSSSRQEELIHSIRKFLRGLDTNGLVVRVTGTGLQEVLLMNSLVKSQLYSLGIAAVVIFLTLIFVFRSFLLAALSIVPNIFPILLNFGMMGAIGIPLDTGTSLIAAVALGIAVDDTIHFLIEYRKQRARGLLVRDTLMKIVENKGLGIVSSSIILCIGFGVMVLSRFVPIIYFGLLCAIIMITGLMGDLVLMPSLILLKRDGSSK